MSKELIQPYTGPQTIDIAAIAELLVDLPPGALRGLRREKPGLKEVVAELAASVPTLGSKAAISSDVYANFLKTYELIQQIRAVRPLVAKLSQVLDESEAYHEDQLEGDISLMVAAVRASARHKNESIRASFEKMLTYNAQIAMKGVKTRQKKAVEVGAAAPGVEGPKEEPSSPT